MKNTRLIEIEISSYCNRTCHWCPNKTIDRKSFAEFMCVETYKNLLNELAASDYSGSISFSRYNEPMTFPEQFKYFTKLVRQMLQKARLVSNTNGDYLSEENLDGNQEI